MRLHRPFTAATARKSFARALHARTNCLARAWNAQTCDSRPAATADGRFDRVVVQRFQTLHSDA
eukprot:4024488-Lingulodinium_polyedra.AAC.1